MVNQLQNKHQQELYEQLNAMALDNFDSVIGFLGLEGEYEGNEFVALNPNRPDNNLGSFKINVKSGKWSDFADTENRGLDTTSFVAFILGVKYHHAYKRLVEHFKNLAIEQHPIVHTHFKDINDEILVVPVPEAAPELHDFFGEKLGKPTMRHEYKNSDGALLCYILRFQHDHGKTFMPATLWKNKAGKYFWKLKALPEPRPLYNLYDLALRSTAPVLIVEGEKAADAAKVLFPEHVVVTTMNGAQSPEKSDWSPLMGKTILCWPDNDEAGVHYIEVVIKLLQKINVEKISVIKTFASKPAYDAKNRPILQTGLEIEQGFDAADAIELGFTPEHIKLLPEDYFKQVVFEEKSYWHGDFFISKRGVQLQKVSDKGTTYMTDVSSRVDVIAETTDEHGRGFGLLLSVSTPNDTKYEWAMPRELLSGNGELYRQQILSLGARIYNNKYFGEYLMAAAPNDSIMC